MTDFEFEQHCREWMPRLKSKARWLARGNVYKAEEILQDGLLVAWKYRAGYDPTMPGSEFGAWLFLIMKQQSLTRWKRGQRMLTVPIERPQSDAQGKHREAFIIYTTSDHVGGGEYQAIVEMKVYQPEIGLSDEMQRALSKLNPDQRATLDMTAEGYKPGVIAKILGENEATVRTRLHSARSICAREYTGIGNRLAALFKKHNIATRVFFVKNAHTVTREGNKLRVPMRYALMKFEDAVTEIVGQLYEQNDERLLA